MPDGHCLRGATSTPGRASRSRAASASAVGHVGAPHRAGAVVAAPARRGVRVVELAAQEHHAALGGVEVLEHGLLLGHARLGDAAVALPVVHPLGAGADPAALDPLGGAVGVEHLEQHLQAGARQVDPRSRSRPWTAAASDSTASVWRTSGSGGNASEAK